MLDEAVGISGPGGDKPAGTPHAFLTRKYSSMGGHQSTKNVQAGKGVVAKQAQQDPIKMESAPSDMSGVTISNYTAESGKKKMVKEIPAPNYGDAASVASWPSAESGKKKVKECFGTMGGQGNEVGDYGRNTESGKKKIKEEAEASGTIARRKVKDVPRPDDEDPKSEKSKLSRLAQIKMKIIDEEKTIPGKTPVILDPVLKQVTPEGDMKSANKRYKKIVKEAIAEAKLPVAGIAGSGLGVMDKLSTAYNQAKAGEYKKALSTAGTAAVQGALTYTPGLGTALQVMAPTPAGAATSEFERQKKLGVKPAETTKPASSNSSSLKKDKSSFGPDTSGFK